MQTLLKQSIIGGLSFLLLTGIAFSVGSSEPSVFSTQADNQGVVIAELYPGGAGGSSTFKKDFIVLYNRSNSNISMTGWSLQYAAAATATFTIGSSSLIFGDVSIAARSYFLILTGSPGSAGADITNYNLTTGALSMSASAGKIALANNSTAITFTAGPNSTFSANTIDYIGYGTTASAYEGSSSAPVVTTTQSLLRKGPLTDNNQNGTDFSAVSVSNPPYYSGTDISAFTTSASNYASDFISNTNNKNGLCNAAGLSWSTLQTSYNALSRGAQVEFGINTSDSTISSARTRYLYLRSFDPTLVNFASL
jgi:hypothetical protein